MSRISESSDRPEAEWTLHAACRVRKMTDENPGDSWKKDSKKQYAGRLRGGERAKMEVIQAGSASSKPNPGLIWYKDDCPYPETCGRVWRGTLGFPR